MTKRRKTTTTRRKGGKVVKLRLMDRIALTLFIGMLLFFIIPWDR